MAGLEPLYHLTDSSIRVHAIYCLLGVSPLQYMHYKAKAVGPTTTMDGLKHELGQIQRIDLLYPPLGQKGRPCVATVTSKQALTPTAPASELQLGELLKTGAGQFKQPPHNHHRISTIQVWNVICQ